MWGEGDPADVIAGRAKRSPLLDGLIVRAIDRVDVSTLGRDILVIAQPRAMAPAELVDLDAWVRRGGRALIFADPRLDWPSRYPLGDPRRAPPVTLLDPLLTHWGVGLVAGSRGEGRWERGPCAAAGAIIIDCRMGSGRVLLVADADVLDARRGDASRLDIFIAALAADRALPSESPTWRAIAAGAALVLSGFSLLFFLLRRRTEIEPVRK